jgi:hypothetical protein
MINFFISVVYEFNLSLKVGQLEGQSAFFNLLYGSSDQFGGQANYGLGSSGLSDLFPPLPSDLDYFQKKSFQVGGRLFLFAVANLKFGRK